MSAPAFHTTFSFSIIGSGKEAAEKIKSIFEQVDRNMLLTGFYTAAARFIQLADEAGNPDILVMDIESLDEFEKKRFASGRPVLVFSDDHPPIVARLNNIFDILPYNTDTTQLESCIAKIILLKNHYQSNALPEEKTVARNFVIKRGKDFQIVNTESVVAFYTDKKITFAFDNAKNKFIIPATLIELENKLDKLFFFRANRQVLINRHFISRIKQISDSKFEIVTSYELSQPVYVTSERFHKLREWIEQH